jgi:hypothetical protein
MRIPTVQPLKADSLPRFPLKMRPITLPAPRFLAVHAQDRKHAIGPEARAAPFALSTKEVDCDNCCSDTSSTGTQCLVR